MRRNDDGFTIAIKIKMCLANPSAQCTAVTQQYSYLFMATGSRNLSSFFFSYQCTLGQCNLHATPNLIDRLYVGFRPSSQ